MIKKVANKLGIDKAIMYTSAARVFQGLGGIISVLLVVRFFTGVEQGFYYTFASILAVQVFFELGFGGIIVQFVAHEAAHLNKDNYTGPEMYRSRLASLFRLCMKWYAVLAILLLIVLSIVGLVFFTYFYKSDVFVAWKLPWISICISNSIYLLTIPFVAFLEGLGKIKEIAKIRLVQQTITQIVSWSSLILGAKLFVGSIATITGIIVLVYLVWRQFRGIIQNIYKIKVTEKISYRNEIFPFQWKIAISWMGSFFIFQLFNPVLFATEGAVAAGQMGMTLSALTVILYLSASWVNTKIPTFSNLIAQKDFVALDKLFYRSNYLSIFVICMGMLTLLICVYAVRYCNIEINGRLLADRFLPIFPMLLMMMSIIFTHITSSWGTYLRCHKQEPMMILNVVLSMSSMLSTVFLGKFFGLIGMTVGYFGICFTCMIWGYFIFIKYKNKWH